jgi:hypothetical protein
LVEAALDDAAYAQEPGADDVDMTLEVVTMPVSDVPAFRVIQEA